MLWEWCECVKVTKYRCYVRLWWGWKVKCYIFGNVGGFCSDGLFRALLLCLISVLLDGLSSLLCVRYRETARQTVSDRERHSDRIRVIKHQLKPIMISIDWINWFVCLTIRKIQVANQTQSRHLWSVELASSFECSVCYN